MPSARATSGWVAAVSSDTRAPPEPPKTNAGVRSSARNSPARWSACICDSDAPVNTTSDAPQLGRSQMRTRWPSAASASASCRIPGTSFENRPPGVITQGGPASPMISYASRVPSTSIVATRTVSLVA